MAWVFLVVAGLFECAWAIGMKYAEGFTRPLSSVLTVCATAISFLFLSVAMRSISAGTAYAVWTGMGTVGVVIWGILFWDEPASLGRMLCILLIACGVVGLNLSASR